MAETLFNEKDLEQIKEQQVSPEKVSSQVEMFKKGFPFTRLAKPCTIGDGIHIIPETEFSRLLQLHNQAAGDSRILKFVPASGAASRMFKVLQSFFNELPSIRAEEVTAKAETNNDYLELNKFIKGIRNFAFFDDLKSVMASAGLDIEEQIAKGEFKEIIDYLLNPRGLNYASLPKGLLKFHSYEEGTRTPFEEHLVEGAAYTKDKNNQVNLHFTVSPEHEQAVSEHFNFVRGKYEALFKVKYQISFSLQKPSTDTIAVDPDNQPFRDKKGSLVFRPAGHGALLENLKDLEGDIVFIKNIDNVVPDHLKETTFLYKKLLAGYLVEIQNTIFDYLGKLSENKVSDDLLSDVFTFMAGKLFVLPPENIKTGTTSEKINFALEKLNRPIRVCGMVKNTGEPGGGPFWVEHPDNSVSLQLVETSQVDPKASDQKALLTSSTHFSPVDLVCGLKCYWGNPFDLNKYVDPDTGFISLKSKDGKDLKAMELPGLWNGAMANWNTVFVEVPIITFNPVKTVNDLLRKEHQPPNHTS
jgi:hypothetical protein